MSARPQRDESTNPVSTDEMAAIVNEVFGDELAEPAPEGDYKGVTWEDAPVLANPVTVAPEPLRPTWTPDQDSMMKLKGKDYLRARYRILWMRQFPVPHPDWTIDTVNERYEPGEWKGPGKVVGGHAVVRANLFDTDGRLIATGQKTEYSENFTDFLEKAETGAIARCLAVAGYGTESALELDEGIPDGASEPRIADAPVGREVGSPITITPSAVPGIRQGGRSDRVTSTQLTTIARLTRESGLGPVGLADTVGIPISDPEDLEATQGEVLRHLRELSFEQAGELIQTLSGLEVISA